MKLLLPNEFGYRSDALQVRGSVWSMRSARTPVVWIGECCFIQGHPKTQLNNSGSQVIGETQKDLWE